VRRNEGHDAEPSAGIVDARSVRGAATVTGSTRGYDAGKKISGRKTFGVVDTLGLLVAVAVVVVAASTSDNVGWDRGRGPGLAPLEALRQAEVRLRVQDRLRPPLPPAPHRRGGGQQNAPGPVRRPPTPLGRRADMAWLISREPGNAEP